MCTCLALPDVPISERGHAVCSAYRWLHGQLTLAVDWLASSRRRWRTDVGRLARNDAACLPAGRQPTGRRRGSLRKLAKTDAKTNDVDCRASFAKTDTSLDEGTGAVVFASHSTAIHVVTSFVFVDRRVPRLRARTSRRQPPSPSSFASCNEGYMPCLPCMRRHGRQAIHTVHLLKTPFHPTTTIKFNHFFYSEIRVYWLVFYGGKTALIALCNPERLSCRPGN